MPLPVAGFESTSPVLVTLDDGVRLMVDLADGGIGVAIAQRRFELNELDFVRRTVTEGQHVVDGGAHAGYYALSMARLVGPRGRIVAFEPVPATARWLELGVAENHFEGVVWVERAALAADGGEGEIVGRSGGVDAAKAYLRHGDAPLPHGHVATPVRTVALDAFPLPRPIHFVRLDVEGAEGLVVDGARRLLHEDRPILLIEVHVDLIETVSGTSAQDLLRRLRTMGYHCRALGAGLPGEELDEAPACGVHALVFLP